MVKKNHKPERLERKPENMPDQILHRIQAELMPEHALDVVAINMLNGEYVLGKLMREALDAFRVRWSELGQPVYLCRVDGGGVCRM